MDATTTPVIGGTRLYDPAAKAAFGPLFGTDKEAKAFLRWYREDVLTDGIGWEDESDAPPQDIRELSAEELSGFKHVWDVNKSELLPLWSAATA